MVPSPRRDEYFPVLFVEPMKGSELAVGFDLASNPTRLETLNEARDTGRMLATAAVTLDQGNEKQKGFLIFVPIYKKHAPINTIELRRQNLEGFVLGVCRMKDLIESALAHLSPKAINVHVLDRSAETGKQYLYCHMSNKGKVSVDTGNRSHPIPQVKIQYSEALDVAGRQWSILCTPTKQLLATGRTWKPWAALAGTLIITFLLVSYLWSVVTQSLRVKSINRDLENEVLHCRQVEAELQQEHDLLDQRINERTVELQKSHERLSQAKFDLVQQEKMGMLGQLAAGVAHEVNTPTAAILNSSIDAGEHLQGLVGLIMKLDKLPTETRRWLVDMFTALFENGATSSEIDIRGQRRKVEKVLREAGFANSRRMGGIIAAYQMAELVDDEEFIGRLADDEILSVLEHVAALKLSADISEVCARRIARIVRSLRIYAYNDGEKLMDCDVNESIDNALVIIKNRITQVAKVQTNLEESLPLVIGGADLMQVWTNILSNACDAIEESMTEGLGLIKISSNVRDGKAVVEIFNDGEAIPEEVLQKVFDPFFTTNASAKVQALV